MKEKGRKRERKGGSEGLVKKGEKGGMEGSRGGAVASLLFCTHSRPRVVLLFVASAGLERRCAGGDAEGDLRK